MRYLIVIDDLGPGGAQRQMVNLALQLIKLGHSVDISIYGEKEHYTDILIQSRIRIAKINIKDPLKRLLVFRKFIRGEQYNFVISYLGIPNFICELAAFPCRKWKLIVNERSANPVIYRSLKSRFRRLFHVFADAIVCNSYANKLIIREVNPFIRGNKIKVIYNMVDLDTWSPIANFKYLEGGILHILIAASHRNLKNMMGLLRAINLLNEDVRCRLKISWYGNNLTPPFYDDSIVECRTFH